MRLTFATSHLNIHGLSYAGFPLLLGDDCEPLEPAQTFLWHLLGNAGRIGSKRTWRKYGQDLYDFVAFLEANRIDWKKSAERGMPGPLERYIEWARGTVGLVPSTVNARVRLAVRFYKWAHKQKLIEELPFNEIAVWTPQRDTFLQHVEAGPKHTMSVDVLLKAPEPILQLLTKNQLAVCLETLTNETHRLMLQFMARSGLRQEEVRTFPESYVFDPKKRRDITTGQMIMVSLNPSVMKTKGSKPRVIEIPYSLMEDLWWWSVRRRPSRAAMSKSEVSTSLFITESGVQYSDSAFTSFLKTLSIKVGFRVRAHMARHTYATYRLRSLRKSQSFEGDPLLYVMDRLGHSSAKTTARYLKYVNLIDGQLVLQHEDELDGLFVQDFGGK